MIELRLVKNSEKEMFYNIFQKYLYEITNYYDDEMDDNGNYSYRYFNNYFTEMTRKALFIIFDGKIAGFVMINNHSYITQNPDYVISEFSIFPTYRKKGIAQKSIDLVFAEFQGKWELKFSLNNKSAMNFWRKVTDKFQPIVHKLEDDEEVLVFETN